MVLPVSLSGRWLAVLQSELLRVWLPTLAVCLFAIFVRKLEILKRR